MTYTWESHNKIYKNMFGVSAKNYGTTSLGSYRAMMTEIQVNYKNDPVMAKNLNDLIMPYYEDIKANPNKVLMPIN